ncbi:MAG: porin [Henriciella sp.]|nr:porin [Henriciella sp.]
MLKQTLAPCAVLILLPSAATAQGLGAVEAELDFESVLLVSPHIDSNANADAEKLQGEISFMGLAETVLENGVRIRARGALRLQADHSMRPGAIGGFGTDEGAPVGAFSGLSSAPSLDQSHTRARLETAYVQIDGGYGEVRVGKDRGVAARFFEGPKSALTHARLDSSLLDPTGLAVTRTRHDLTGPSLKASYASPRLIGLRAGISFTPEADADGLDRRPAAGTGGLASDTRSAIELALNGTHRFRESDWRFDVGLGWSNAEVSNRGPLSELSPIYEDMQTWSAGTRIEKGDWTVGASWLNSDNGLPNGDYSSWTTGLFKEAYDIDFSVEYGESEDQLSDLESQGWRLAAARDFGRDARVAVAYLHDDLQAPLQKWSAQGVVIEVTLSQEIVQVTGN